MKNQMKFVNNDFTEMISCAFFFFINVFLFNIKEFLRSLLLVFVSVIFK